MPFLIPKSGPLLGLPDMYVRLFEKYGLNCFAFF